MKKTMLFLFMSIILMPVWAQDEIALCHTPAVEKFALFASNKSFNTEHPNPRVYVHQSKAGGTMIKFKCPDGTEANAYLLKAKVATDNWIFVFQEWWD